MKKKRDDSAFLSLKTIRIMKIALMFILVGIFQVSATTYAQEHRISVSVENGNFYDVVSQIEKQSEFMFFYKSEEIDNSQKISLNVNNKLVSEILDEITKNNNLTYKIIDKHIIITKAITHPQAFRKITGIITDKNGEPIAGANIVEKGTTNGTITDIDGCFSLDVADKAVLVVSYIGYDTQNIFVTSKNSYNIQLTEDTKALEEVVVIGYGTMKKSDFTGAVASIKGDKMVEKASFVKVSEALQGMTPGLMVTRNGGSDASASSSIRIRGVTTIGDSNPLIIIDGIPASSLDVVSPNDIENISILKDAASAAIYGSRAASGVIVVTTKRAKDGHLNLSYDYSFTFEQPTRLASYTDAAGYMKLHNERTWNDNGNIPGGEYSTFSKETIDNYSQLNVQNSDKYPNTNWHDMMLKKWIYKNRHTIGISAGSKHIKTYISLNIDDTEGLYMGKDYNRFTIRANNDISINKYFSADLNLNGVYSKISEPQTSQSGQAVVPGQILAAIYPAEWSDGRIAPGKGGENPYAVLKHAGSIDSKSSLFGGKFQLNFTPFEGLKFSAAYSAELYNIKEKNFRKQLTFTNFEDPLTPQGLIMGATTTKLKETRDDRLSTTLQFLGTYNKHINKHYFQLMIGYEENTDTNEYLGATRDEYLLKNFPYLDLGNANFQFNSGSASEYANRSVFGRGVYNFDNKYLLQTNIRYDGSSRFHKNHRWGVFPSFSAGWVMSEEFFMKEIDELSYLKLRGSWGRLGNEKIGLYPYQSTIGFNSLLLYKGNSVVSAQGAGVLDYSIPDISWETSESYDIGIDVGFFNNKLMITGDYYKKTTKDMLLAIQIPSFIGMNNPQQNTGKMYTKGWELLVNWNDNIGDFRYAISAHLSDSKSIMGDLGGTEFLDSKVKFEGSEFDEWYGYKSDGLYQTQNEIDNSATLYNNLKPGDIKYVDISGPDGKPDGKISAEYDRVLLGGSLPRFLYGGNIDIGYKNFDLGLVFQGVGKQNSYIDRDWVDPYFEFPTLIVGNSWSVYNTEEQNQMVKYPRLTATNRSNNYATSDFWLFNGAYFRLKNISFSYSIKNVNCFNTKLNTLKFTASVSDLFSIDNYPDGWDPETTSNYWITRAFTLGVSVKF